MSNKLIILPAGKRSDIRLVKAPEDCCEPLETYRHMTGLIARVEEENPDYSWDDTGWTFDNSVLEGAAESMLKRMQVRSLRESGALVTATTVVNVKTGGSEIAMVETQSKVSKKRAKQQYKKLINFALVHMTHTLQRFSNVSWFP